MPARRYEDLQAWQLANELKRRIYELIDTSVARRDGRFCDQLRGCASSAPANLAEGFGYYDHPLFGKHVRIAKASLDETRNHLKDGVDRRYWTDEEVAPLVELTNRATGKCVRLAQYLARTTAPGTLRRRGSR